MSACSASAPSSSFAAADLYPPALRAEGPEYVLPGSLVGALGGPVVELLGLPALAFVSAGLQMIPLLMLLRLDETARKPVPQAVQAPHELRA